MRPKTSADNADARDKKNAAPPLLALRFYFAPDKFSDYISRVFERGGDCGDGGGMPGFHTCRLLNPDLADLADLD
ncbi:MAG: hypothetical protein ACREQR_14585 [Candidatus Binataceae bacterium]